MFRKTCTWRGTQGNAEELTNEKAFGTVFVLATSQRTSCDLCTRRAVLAWLKVIYKDERCWQSLITVYIKLHVYEQGIKFRCANRKKLIKRSRIVIVDGLI